MRTRYREHPGCDSSLLLKHWRERTNEIKHGKEIRMKKVLLANIICMAIFLIVGIIGPARAASENYKDITAPEVKSMIDGGKGLVVHVLSEIEYEMQHITGSINIPIIKVKTSKKLPKDKNTSLVFYCMGKR